MKKSFRKYHLLRALESFDFASLPLDVHLGRYFRANKAIGSKDRKEIAEKIYTLIRWMGLIDHHCQEGHDWEERLETLERINLNRSQKDSSLPSHIRASFPKNLFALFTKHFGESGAITLCQNSNTPAPTTIRINVLKTSRHDFYGQYKEKYDLSLTKESVFGIHFGQRCNFAAMEEFKNGFFEVQDEASQIVANMVEAEAGQKVLDFCAGSGGKTLAFAHRLQGKGQIFLHDIRPAVLENAKKRLKRAGIENAQILPYDSSQKEALRGKMDWVLVDVPCSGTGTLRRNPDMKWKFSEEMLQRIVQEQRKIFAEALQFLAPKGKILYATCSLLPEENEQQVEYFCWEHGLLVTEKPFQSLPTEGGMDGFFATCMKREEN